MDHKTENQLSYGWMKGFSTVQLEIFSEKSLQVSRLKLANFQTKSFLLANIAK